MMDLGVLEGLGFRLTIVRVSLTEMMGLGCKSTDFGFEGSIRYQLG